ncbi:hypothetical protein [Haloplasma contractile]|uniref:hypothetical protein n=1 Tax=Haloplasma contractile TaxID=471825 RepID=UPI000212211F|nr:hypothetical protein [Haloplasma contractile]
MNKFKLLEMVLEKYDEKMDADYRIKEQNELIALFLKEPDASSSYYQKHMNRIVERDISKNELFIMKRFLWLNCKYFTNMFIQDVKILTHYLFTFYNENVTYYEKIISKMNDLNKITDTKNIYKNYNALVYRAALCLFFSNDVFNGLKNKHVIKCCSGSYARFFLEDLTELIANHLEIKTKKKQKTHFVDVIKESLEQIEQLKGPHKKRDDYVASLEFQLETIKSNFEQIRHLYEEQSKTLEDYKKTLEDNPVITFFKQFNSSRHGNVLDQISFTEHKIRELEKSGFVFKDEIRSLPLLIKQLAKFLKSMGIAPIKQLNETYWVKVDDIEFFEYEGEPFYSEDEEKEVIVISEGWTYKGKVIANPKVREV